MINETNLNLAEFYQLQTDIRVSSTSAFNAREAYENTFEDLMLEQVTNLEHVQQEQETNKVNFYNLGPPPGFFIEATFLSEESKI